MNKLFFGCIFLLFNCFNLLAQTSTISINGIWTKEGTQWGANFNAELSVDSKMNISGRIKWTYYQIDRKSYDYYYEFINFDEGNFNYRNIRRRDAHAYEYVAGVYDTIRNSLKFQGSRVWDPAHIIALDEYEIELFENEIISGRTATNDKDWSGVISGKYQILDTHGRSIGIKIRAKNADRDAVTSGNSLSFSQDSSSIQNLNSINGATHKKIIEQIENETFNGYYTHKFNEFEYTGEFKNGIPHGRGKVSLPDGSWYEGEFKNGLPNGYGTERMTDGLRYTGTFINGVPNGKFKVERWTMLGLYRDEWIVNYDMGKVVGSSQTQTGMTDFINGSSINSGFKQNFETKDNSKEEKTEKKVVNVIVPEVKSIKFTQKKSYLVNGESDEYFVTFKDGISGYLWYSVKLKHWFISDGINDYDYNSKENAIAALYEYKKHGTVRKIGLK